MLRPIAPYALPEMIAIFCVSIAICFLIRSKNLEKVQAAKITAELENARKSIQHNLAKQVLGPSATERRLPRRALGRHPLLNLLPLNKRKLAGQRHVPS